MLFWTLIASALTLAWCTRSEAGEQRYLSLTLCTRGLLIGGEISCSMRVFEIPLDSVALCERHAASVIRTQTQTPEGYWWRLPRQCTKARPDYPLVPSQVTPWRFA